VAGLARGLLLVDVGMVLEPETLGDLLLRARANRGGRSPAKINDNDPIWEAATASDGGDLDLVILQEGRTEPGESGGGRAERRV
jgi:hypothetical protein